ncbi:hypothetical protein GGI12_002838 [Dipsacomyces acuminosporus]|nr:hypothetical protein GGI12_002838 [Dipsacomyces acuminosporus]
MDALHYHSVSEPCAYARLYYEPGRRFSESLLSELTHPLLSPINADFTDMPPTLIQYGDLELIVDDITEMYERIVKQNPGREKDIVCECYKGMFHDFQLIVDTKDALEAFNGIKEFVKGL